MRSAPADRVLLAPAHHTSQRPRTSTTEPALTRSRPTALQATSTPPPGPAARQKAAATTAATTAPKTTRKQNRARFARPSDEFRLNSDCTACPPIAVRSST
ncbi:hypothetical protein GCM10027456_71170 [Kineosporia babensis]